MYLVCVIYSSDTNFRSEFINAFSFQNEDMCIQVLDKYPIIKRPHHFRSYSLYSANNPMDLWAMLHVEKYFNPQVATHQHQGFEVSDLILEYLKLRCI